MILYMCIAVLVVVLAVKVAVVPPALFSVASGSFPGHTRRRLIKLTSLRAHTTTMDGLQGDPWAVMGLSSEATRSEVKARFRELVREYHPDVCPTGSGYMMTQVIRAAQAILDSVPQPEPKSPRAEPKQQVSRYEKMRAKQEKARAAHEYEHRLLYTGRSRLRGGKWSDYRITASEIEMSWPLGPGAKVWGADAQKTVQFKDVRHVSRYVDLEGGRRDVELELLWGTRLTGGGDLATSATAVQMQCGSKSEAWRDVELELLRGTRLTLAGLSGSTGWSSCPWK